MRTALLSDVHGNRHAFEAVLAATAEDGVDAIWCLGDLVGYGADPNTCVALARERCSIVLAGNHDLAVTGDLSLEEFSRGAALAAHWTQGVIAEEHLRPPEVTCPLELGPAEVRCCAHRRRFHHAVARPHERDRRLRDHHGDDDGERHA